MENLRRKQSRTQSINLAFILTTILFLATGCADFVDDEDEFILGEERDKLVATLTTVQNQQPINDFICELFEIYDVSTSKCEPSKTCQTTVECALLGDKLAEMILERYGDLLTDYEFGGEEDGDVYGERALVQYELDGPLLSNPQFFDIDTAFLAYRDDIENACIYLGDVSIFNSRTAT